MIGAVRAAVPAIEMLPRPGSGRVFTGRRRVRLGDVDRRGRLRLDATARFLQDVATDDADDAGLDRRFGWVVRRTTIHTLTPARIGEHVDVATWCSGTGRSWAERRTSIEGDRGGRVETVALWVQVEIASGMPARVAGDFHDAYDEAAGGRTISSRLSLPAAPTEADRRTWAVRRTDLDPFDHVNNAATWEFLEEVARLDADDADRRGRAELEHVRPVTPEPPPTIAVSRTAETLDAWLIAGEAVVSAARWTPA